MDLKGVVALVTGGNGGLGQRICHALAQEGAHIAVVYARSRDQAESFAGELERFPLDLNREDYRGSLGRANRIRFLGPQRRGCAMAKGYSKDLRERVVAIVEEGDSAREAARLLNVGASTAIRWIERWTTTGSVEASPAPAIAARR